MTTDENGQTAGPRHGHFRPKTEDGDQKAQKGALEEPPTNPGLPPVNLTGPVRSLPLPPPVVPPSLAEPVTAQVDAFAPVLPVPTRPPAAPSAPRAATRAGLAPAPARELRRTRWVRSPIRAAESLTVLPPRSTAGLAGQRPGGLAGAATAGTAPPAVASSARNAAIMAAGTSLSRVSGFARLLAVAWVLGQERLADAYNQANTVPNTVYDLLLGGVLSATLLPVLMQSLTRRSGERDEETVPSVITLLTIVLVIATGVFWLAAPEIIRFFLSRRQWPGGGRRAGISHYVVEVVHTAVIVYRPYYNYHCVTKCSPSICVRRF